MSYSLKTNHEGELMIAPLEVPMYEGEPPELIQQAILAMVSASNHLRMMERMYDLGLDEECDEEAGYSTECINTAIMSLASIAYMYNLEIMNLDEVFSE